MNPTLVDVNWTDLPGTCSGCIEKYLEKKQAWNWRNISSWDNLIIFENFCLPYLITENVWKNTATSKINIFN